MRGLIALAALALMSCAPVANEPAATPVPAPAPVSATKPDTGEVSASDCAARGGSMQRVGRLQSLQCVTPYADGGRACTDGAQCSSGRCIDETPEATATAASGMCQRTNFQFGCFALVSGGRQQAALCVD